MCHKILEFVVKQLAWRFGFEFGFEFGLVVPLNGY
jgi:hypothetical protein